MIASYIANVRHLLTLQVIQYNELNLDYIFFKKQDTDCMLSVLSYT